MSSIPSPGDPHPSEQQVRAGLKALVRGGVPALWGRQARPLFDLPAARRRLIDPSHPEAPNVVREIVEAGIERMPSQEYRDLLMVVLGLAPVAEDLSAHERRELAGTSFRGGTSPVAAGTIRQYHEPRALDLLATTLLGLDAEGDRAALDRPPVPQPPGEQTARSSLTCFVIGPIGNRLAAVGTREREVYEEALRVMAEVIEPACASHGLTPVRADSIARAGEITAQVFRRLHEDDVVIADLTDANPNVMYELGLRHTRDKLTVQIGEFGRLPFDVSTIRTIQFSRSPVGLITARDELIQVLETGIRGDYDPVAATSVWNRSGSPRDEAGDASAAQQFAPQTDGNVAVEQDFLDILAEAEEQQEALPAALEAVGNIVGELGALAERATEEMARSDAAGKGMRGRLNVVTRYAQSVDAIAGRLDEAVGTYESILMAVSAAAIVIIKKMETDPDAREEGREFGMLTRRAAAASRDAMASLAGLVDSIKVNAAASRVLREPSRRLTDALDRFVDATSVADEWDRRLQALNIPMPADDWSPELEPADRRPNLHNARSNGADDP
jgi:hypothetical protein